MIPLEPSRSPARDGYHLLAIAVLQVAVNDARAVVAAKPRDDWNADTRNRWLAKVSALDFLGQENPLLRHWCDMAGVQPRAFVCKFESTMLAWRRARAAVFPHDGYGRAVPRAIDDGV